MQTIWKLHSVNKELPAGQHKNSQVSQNTHTRTNPKIESAESIRHAARAGSAGRGWRRADCAVEGPCDVVAERGMLLRLPIFIEMTLA